MKPDYHTRSSVSPDHVDELSGCDPYLAEVINHCHDAAGIRRAENIAVVFDELGSTFVRRRAALLSSAGRG